MAEPARAPDPYAALRELPRHLVGEIIDGVLHTQPRPSLRHAQAATVLGEELGPPFKRGRGGPGGWRAEPFGAIELQLGLLWQR